VILAGGRGTRMRMRPITDHQRGLAHKKYCILDTMLYSILKAMRSVVCWLTHE
jgi:dTDP-glucose pyrophosphorylase